MATRHEMPGHEEATMLDRVSDGRTDLVFEYLAEGHVATSTDADGVSLMKWCGRQWHAIPARQRRIPEVAWRKSRPKWSGVSRSLATLRVPRVLKVLWRTVPIRIARRRPMSKQMASCATAERRVKRRFIEPPPLEPKRVFSFFLMRAQSSMPKTCMAILR